LLLQSVLGDSFTDKAELRTNCF